MNFELLLWSDRKNCVHHAAFDLNTVPPMPANAISMQANIEHGDASPDQWRSHALEQPAAFGTPVFAAAAAAACQVRRIAALLVRTAAGMRSGSRSATTSL